MATALLPPSSTSVSIASACGSNRCGTRRLSLIAVASPAAAAAATAWSSASRAAHAADFPHNSSSSNSSRCCRAKTSTSCFVHQHSPNPVRPHLPCRPLPPPLRPSPPAPPRSNSNSGGVSSAPTPRPSLLPFLESSGIASSSSTSSSTSSSSAASAGEVDAEGPCGLVGGVVEQLVAAFVRSQCSSVGELRVTVAGRNRDLLTGQVPSATIAATDVCYKGIVLSSLRLRARDVCIQPPRLGPQLPPSSQPAPASILKQAFQVEVEAHVTLQHLNESLCSSSLFKTAVHEFLHARPPTASRNTGQPPELMPSEIAASPRPDTLVVRLRPAQLWEPAGSGIGSPGVAAHGRGRSTSPQRSSETHTVELQAHVPATRRSSLHVQLKTSAGSWSERVRAVDLGPGVSIESLRMGRDGVQLTGLFTVTP